MFKYFAPLCGLPRLPQNSILVLWRNAKFSRDRYGRLLVAVSTFFVCALTLYRSCLAMLGTFSSTSSWAQSNSERSEEQTERSDVWDLRRKSSTPLRSAQDDGWNISVQTLSAKSSQHQPSFYRIFFWHKRRKRKSFAKRKRCFSLSLFEKSSAKTFLDRSVRDVHSARGLWASYVCALIVRRLILP